MHYEGSFKVSSDKEKVYAFITNLEKFTAVFPDVEDVKVLDENNATLRAKVGISFIKGTVNVKLAVTDKKEAVFVKMKARGTGNVGSVDMDSTFNLEDSDGGTQVKWATDAMVGGTMAGVGSRLMDAASNKYIKQIISTVQKKLS